MVGYGLEGMLTDLTSGRIIRDVITPQLRNGNFDQGVINGFFFGRRKMPAAGLGGVIAPVIGGLFLGFQWLILPDF